jgi:hypothetical protein
MLVESWNSDQVSCVAASHRQARSGGYPKFPLHEYQPPTCGTRDVTHEPSRVGQPAAKIVGGSVAPYGAYPWQVSVMMAHGMFTVKIPCSVVVMLCVRISGLCTSNLGLVINYSVVPSDRPRSPPSKFLPT